MKRRAALLAREKETVAPVLHDIDYLLGVFDETRMALSMKITTHAHANLDKHQGITACPRNIRDR